MRLWSIHPQYLDSKGLVALWREALLAQKVLSGRTKGYKNHPQLIRFKETKDPAGSMAIYLENIWSEAQKRGYQFDQKKIGKRPAKQITIKVTTGQSVYEMKHLKRKLIRRDPEKLKTIKNNNVKMHPMFRSVVGEIAEWEVQ
jgi:hypothetical protein